MGIIFNRGKGIGSKTIDLLDKTANIVAEAVTDKDKQNELQYSLMELRANLLLSGKESSTKITINILVSLIIGCLCYSYMFNPALIENAQKLSAAAFPYVSILVGGFAGGTIAKRFIEKKIGARTNEEDTGNIS